MSTASRWRALATAICLAAGAADVVYLGAVLAPSALASSVDEGASRAASTIAPEPTAAEVPLPATVFAEPPARPTPQPLPPVAPLAAAIRPSAESTIVEPPQIRAEQPEALHAETRTARREMDAENETTVLHYERAERALDPNDRQILAELRARWSTLTNARIRIEGHADETGSQWANQWISRERAEVVARHLELIGVPRERMDVRGLGAEHPADASGTPAALRRNRRVEVTLEEP